MSIPLRLPALISLVVLLIPCSATAGPITFGPTGDVDARHLGDVLVLGRNHTLTLDDLRVLEALDDNGWHLGWFKRKLKGNGGDDSPGLDGIPTITLPGGGLSLNDPAPGNTVPPIAVGGGQSPDLDTAAVPEPASLLLFASGLLVVARRRLRNRAR